MNFEGSGKKHQQHNTFTSWKIKKDMYDCDTELINRHLLQEKKLKEYYSVILNNFKAFLLINFKEKYALNI